MSSHGRIDHLLFGQALIDMEANLAYRDALPAKWGLNFGDDWYRIAYRWGNIGGKVVKTRRPDVELMNDMGIEEEIREIFASNSLSGFFDILLEMETYEDLTTQFLATFTVGEDRVVQFLLQGQPRQVTFAQISEALGFPTEGRGRRKKKSKAKDYDPHKFWAEITGDIAGDTYRSQRARVCFIRNPIILYLERILGNTLFARTETGTVTKEELYCLWCLLHNEKFDFAKAFVEHQLTLAYTEGTNVKIRSGGLISRIIHFLGYDHHPDSGPLIGPDLGFEHLSRTQLLDRKMNRVCFRFLDGNLFPLPNLHLVTTAGTPRDRPNWGMFSKEHLDVIGAFQDELISKGLIKEPGNKRQRGEGSSRAQEDDAEEQEEEQAAAPAEDDDWRLSQGQWDGMVARVNTVYDQVGDIHQWFRDMYVSQHGHPPPPRQ